MNFEIDDCQHFVSRTEFVRSECARNAEFAIIPFGACSFFNVFHDVLCALSGPEQASLERRIRMDLIYTKYLN